MAAEHRSDRRDAPGAAVLFVITLAVGAFSTWLIWGHLQDDTFIHLRYVANMGTPTQIEYNPGQHSFGTSSLAYDYLLWAVVTLLPAAAWPAAAKVVSVAAYAAALTAAAVVLRRSPLHAEATGRGRVLAWLMLIVLLASPATARWMQDGMETSLAVAAVAVLVLRIQSTLNRPDAGLAAAITTGVAVAMPAVVRVDLLPVTGIAGLVLLLIQRGRAGAAVATGAAIVVAWFGWTYYVFGALVSDAGMAKQRPGAYGAVVAESARMMAIVPVLWLAGLVVVVGVARQQASRVTAIVVLLSAAPIAATFLMALINGQRIHGARYFLGSLLFLIGMLVVLQMPRAAEAWTRRVWVAALAASAVQAVVFLPSLVALGSAENDVRSAEFRPGETVAVYDIGRLGWYAPIRVVDLAGLVNGKAVAETPGDYERFCRNVQETGVPSAIVAQQRQTLGIFGQSGPALTLRCGDLVLPYEQQDNYGMRVMLGATQEPSVYDLYRLVTR
jgi:hypothetical protein